jgi:hypothetical protein
VSLHEKTVVSLTIDDTTPTFLAYWDQAAGLSVAEQRRLWHEWYEASHPEVFSAYYRRHGRVSDLETALARFPEEVPRLRQGIATLKRGIEATAARLGGIFAAPDVDLRWVLMVGLFSSDGWVDWVADEPVCFCAVEYVEDLKRADVLLAHEAAHVFHVRCNPERCAEMETVGHALFLEGLAVHASAQVVPGADEAGYLWAGKRRVPANGQGVGDWAVECEAKWPQLRESLLRELRSEEEEVYAAWFLGRRVRQVVPVRAGYFVGYRLLAELGERHSIADMARWSAARVLAEITQELERAAQCPRLVAS